MSILALFHPGDLGLEGLLILAVIILMLLALIAVPTFLVMYWLATKLGDWANRKDEGEQVLNPSED